MRLLKCVIVLLSCFGALNVSAQETIVFGNVLDIDSKMPIELATIYIKGTSKAVESDLNGAYRLIVESDKSQTIVCSRLGYGESEFTIPAMRKGAKRNVNFELVNQEGPEVIIRESRIEDIGMVKEEVTELKYLPTASGNFESVLPAIALGVSSGTGGELSSQYNVRGGNYDENLVYVNDFEIFRPQLIRSGQQEGLSFPNIAMIRDLKFSSGGFEAQYGDKMSSVLDISYKRPDKFKSSAELSFLGAGFHVEGSKRLGANSYNKLRYILGARYKTTQYLLGTLDVKGEYTPNFADIQAYLTYDITRDLQLGFLGNYNSANYNFIPTERSTALGLIDFALQLTTVFEGGESDRFRNGMTGLSLTYLPERDKNPLYLKLLASNYLGEELETFDIIGHYRLSQIETDFGSDNLGEEIAVLGTGTQHQFARNSLYSHIYNVQHKGGIEFSSEREDKDLNNFLQWGAKWQHQEMDDVIKEWERLDSAGYSLPFSAEEVILASSLRSENLIVSDRFSGFAQNTFGVYKPEKSELKLTTGVRANYWSLNKELTVSPRAQLLYKPLKAERDISFKLAGGVYYQTPFYREIRRTDGTINADIKSQRSIHAVFGMTHDFYWKKINPKKPFKLITELYYKKLDDLVSYEVDNVRIRYSGENDASGHIAGIDLRINGEFVEGAESWVNISFLRAVEKLDGVQHLQRFVGDSIATAVKFVPRPTDRIFNISMFFQDYLPRNENFKMHLNLSVGGGLPFGLRGNNQVYRNTYRFSPYNRVDMGFSYLMWNEKMRLKKPQSVFRNLENVWLSLEVFNLMDVANEASNTWIKTIINTQYAIPNYLTSRRINLRCRVDF